MIAMFALALNIGQVAVTSPQALSPSKYVGNKFVVVRGTEDVRAGWLPEAASIRFTSPKTGDLLRIYYWITWGAEGGWPSDAPQYRMELRTNNKLIPTNIKLATFDLGGGSIFKSAGWRNVTLNPPITLTAATTYHLVFYVTKWSHTTYHPRIVLNAFKLSGAYFGAPDHTAIIPKTQWVDSALGMAKYDANIHDAWVPIDQTPIFILEYTDGTFHGQPYTSLFMVSFSRATGPNAVGVGQEFSVSSNRIVNRVGAWVRKAYGTPDDNLYISLYDKTNNAYLAKNLVLLTPSAKTSWNFYKVLLPSPVTLESTHNYRLEVTSSNYGVNGCYEISMVGSRYTTPEIAATIYGNGATMSMDGATWMKEPYLNGTFWDLGFILA